MTSVLPVVCAFDQNLCVPAKVTFCTLKHHVSNDTQLCIYVLHSDSGLPEAARLDLMSGFPAEERHSLQFIDVGDAFSHSFQIRGITPPTYYRLLLPSLPVPFDKILYLDVDIAVVDYIDSVLRTELNGAYLGGVRGIFTTMNPERIRSIGADPDEYVNAGVLLMDLRRMRADNLQKDFVDIARQELEFQDQDVLNIRCKGRISHLHPQYNVHCMFDYEQQQNLSDTLWPRDCWQDAVLNPTVLHYAGEKPWNGSKCFYYDVWWKWYHQSSAADREFYLSHQRQRLKIQVARETPAARPAPGLCERVGRRCDLLLKKIQSRCWNKLR